MAPPRGARSTAAEIASGTERGYCAAGILRTAPETPKRH
jgi:hypothetical protein